MTNQPLAGDRQPYAGWILQQWHTPLSGLRDLSLASLCDRDGQLELRFVGGGLRGDERWIVRFTDYPGYRNILEECRTDLGQRLASQPGSTFVVTNSPWLQQLKALEPLVDVHHPDLRHFVFVTGDDVVEVLSPQAPDIVPEET